MIGRFFKWGVLIVLMLLAYRLAYHPVAKTIFLWKVRNTAGVTAIECGHIGTAHDPTQATLCANEALASNKPFWVAFDLHGIDSSVSVGLSRDKNGTVQRFWYDSNRGGFCLLFCVPSITRSPCEKPNVKAKRLMAPFEFWSVSVTCNDDNS